MFYTRGKHYSYPNREAMPRVEIEVQFGDLVPGIKRTLGMMGC